MLLGAFLLVVLNLPDSVTDRAKGVVREATAPLQAAVTGLTRKTRNAVEAVRGLGGLVVENEKMSAELVHLRNEVRHLRNLEEENRRLREQLGYAARNQRRLIPGEVIARDISGWWQTLRLGKGTVDGIELNMAVITSDGLVGRTIAVSPRTCDVLLVSDPTCKVSAKIARVGVFGIVSGRGLSGGGRVVCEMNFMNKDAAIREGDEVVTSGLGGVYPKGLLLGYVEQVTVDESGLYQSARVIPKADLGAVSYVFCVSEEEDPVEELLRERTTGAGGGS